jgi:hypothetical protein
MRITYNDGDDRVVSFGPTINPQKRWRKVNTIARKRVVQATSFPNFNSTDEYDFVNKGLGGRYKWLVRSEDVYHEATATIVEENFHHARAVCISPGSRIDMLLQKAYHARRNTAKKGHTDEQKTTTK